MKKSKLRELGKIYSLVAEEEKIQEVFNGVMKEIIEEKPKRKKKKEE